jgi:hypothetical protein
MSDDKLKFWRLVGAIEGVERVIKIGGGETPSVLRILFEYKDELIDDKGSDGQGKYSQITYQDTGSVVATPGVKTVNW